MRYLFLVLFAGAVAGCDTGKGPDSAAVPPLDPAPVVDMHTSRIALDWSGLYEGVLDCADCAGLHTRLTLNEDASFEIVARQLVRGAVPSSGQGQFVWEPGDNTIVLDAVGGGQRFAVGEGRLVPLATGQPGPEWGRPDAVLAKSSPDWRGMGQDLVDLLEEHSWALVDATDPANHRIDALFPDPERAFTFSFAGSRLHVQGGCNGLRGGFVIDADGKLGVRGAMSTLMACEAPLMAADAALAALMAEPLETVLVRGAQPTLVLLTKPGDALVLAGALTPEARFGAPTAVFLEVAAQTLECEGSIRGDGMCLQVRERTFDDRGLLVGGSAEWQTFNSEIEGYRHEPGIRNVVRVKRFQPATGPEGPGGPIYVLDIVVESEVVTQ